MLLGREGARVALVEKQPDPDAFKRMCSHFIQASAVPTIERLDLLEPIIAAGGVRSRIRAWTRWGWIEPPPEQRPATRVNLRREVLDPMVRERGGGDAGRRAAARPHRDRAAARRATAFAGVAVRDRDGARTELTRRLVVGADGRDSQVAELAGVKEKILPHNRFAYGGYFEGAMPEGAPDGTIWFADPQWAAAFPTDGGLIFYAAMPTKDRLPEFKRDPEAALVYFVAELPGGAADPRVSAWSATCSARSRCRTGCGRSAPGLALVGDAALATDPLFGVGCGWAFQSGEWLADAVGSGAARRRSRWSAGLKRYRRRTRAAARPRLHHPRLRDRPEAQPRRAVALLRGRPRREAGGHASTASRPGRSARRGCSRRRCRGRSSSTPATRSRRAARRGRPPPRSRPPGRR